MKGTISKLELTKERRSVCVTMVSDMSSLQSSVDWSSTVTQCCHLTVAFINTWALGISEGKSIAFSWSSRNNSNKTSLTNSFWMCVSTCVWFDLHKDQVSWPSPHVTLYNEDGNIKPLAPGHTCSKWQNIIRRLEIWLQNSYPSTCTLFWMHLPWHKTTIILVFSLAKWTELLLKSENG